MIDGPKYFDLWGNDKTLTYAWNKDARKSGLYRGTINQGGTYSGKTYGITKNLIDIGLEDHGAQIIVTSKDMERLRQDAIKAFKSDLKNPNVRYFFKNPELLEGPFRMKNGSEFHFHCYQDPEDAESGKPDYLYISEAKGLRWDIVSVLLKKVKKFTFIDYNPAYPFWVHKELMHRPEWKVIVSTFKDNKFCPEDKQKELLSFLQEYYKTGSTYWLNQHRVYTQGKTGIVEGLVFPLINTIDRFPDPYYLQPFKYAGMTRKFGYGIDFGYKSSYTAIVKGGMRSGDGRFCGQEMFYKKYNAFDLHILLPALGITKHDLIIADSSHQEAIDVLKRHGYQIFGASKPAGSVKAGIENLNEMGIDLVAGSDNWMIEQMSYEYEKRGGRHDPDIPKDENNHCWDAAAYLALVMKYGLGVKKHVRRGKRKIAIV